MEPGVGLSVDTLGISRDVPEISGTEGVSFSC